MGSITNGIISTRNNSKENFPYALKQNVVYINNAPGSDPTKVYIMRVNVGYPEANSILEAEK